jgi:hypothetical protein
MVALAWSTCRPEGADMSEDLSVPDSGEIGWDGRPVLTLGIVALLCALGVLVSFIWPSLGFGSVMLAVEIIGGTAAGTFALFMARIMRQDMGPRARRRARIGVRLAVGSGVGVAIMLGTVVVMALITSA